MRPLATVLPYFVSHLAAVALSLDEVLIAATPQPGWGPDIVLAGPLTLQEEQDTYEASKQLRFAAEMFTIWVNSEKGGVVLNGVRHAVRVVFYDDENSIEMTSNVTLHAINVLKADAILGGVSTRLTTVVSSLCAQHGKLLLSAGAHTPSLFSSSNLSFGMASYLPTSVSDTINLIVKAAEFIDQSKTERRIHPFRNQADENPVAHAITVHSTSSMLAVSIDTALPESACDSQTTSMGSCRDALVFGFLEETTPGWPQAFCEASRSYTAASGLKFSNSTGNLPLTLNVDRLMGPEEMDAALLSLQRAGITVVTFCGYFSLFKEVVAGLERLDWTPLAVLVGTAAINEPDLEDAVHQNWWQGEYAIGVLQWHWKLPQQGAMSGLTAEEFAYKFRRRTGKEATEYAAAQFQQCLMLVTAIEAAQSLESEQIAQQLQRLQVTDIYGAFSYRPEDGMSGKQNIALQFADGKPEIAYPLNLSTSALRFPQPSFAARRCRLNASPHGYCTHRGLVCDTAVGGHWTGSSCQEWVADTPVSFFIEVIVIPVLCALCIAFTVCCVRKRYQHKHDLKSIHNAIENISRPQYPMVLVKFSTMKQLGKFVMHEDLRNAGHSLCYDTNEELLTVSRDSPIVFISHQWLGYSAPDPNNEHYNATIDACQQLCNGYHIDPDELLIWIDYVSIPQKLQNTQLLAIHSLAIYARCCQYFVIIAPEAQHADSKERCSPDTYLQRGWCRLEQWARLTYGRKGMFLFGVTRKLQLLESEEMREWCRSSIMVFEGDFTCQADKKRLRSTVLGLWAIAVLKKQHERHGFLYDLVKENQKRAFPASLFPRALHNLAERCLLRDDFGGTLKQEVLNVINFSQRSDSECSSPKRLFFRKIKETSSRSPMRVHLKPKRSLMRKHHRPSYPYDLNI
ncbi:hypothetical protein AB1Y20_013719 [Prymnesium parvum]|uniref:Leucine-binding protein domain-containing protein n=1 Tax=Prymnesium parvum TaxID=97485 RepID=A0AB34IJ01_PRYPA